MKGSLVQNTPKKGTLFSAMYCLLTLKYKWKIKPRKSKKSCFLARTGVKTSAYGTRGGTPIYGLYRYVLRDRVYFLRF